MKQNVRQILTTIIVLFFILPISAPCQLHDKDNIYFGIKIKGMLCGYTEMNSEIVNYEETTCKLINNKVHVLLSLMKSGVDMDIFVQYYIDTLRNKVMKVEYNMQVGSTKIGATTIIRDDSIHYTSSSLSAPKSIKNPGDLIIDRPVENPELFEDFVMGTTEAKTYRFFDMTKGEIIEKSYKKLRIDTVEVSGKPFVVVVLSELNRKSGEKTEFWMDVENGQVIRAIFPSREVFLADKSIIKKISAAQMDDVLFYSVNEVIPDASKLSYMKIKAKIESAGEVLSVESLNIPGQKFTGTVTDNIVDGVFELEHERYNGDNAPPFPPDFSGNEELEEYLEPSEFIESDEEVLINKAKKITEGSSTSWEAVIRLSIFVSEYIDYSIPGGATALKTYKTRLGECGGHSRLLTALCRGVGIPARLAIGCIYSYYNGGVFGQHAWTEVYMGDAGWIPVDATAGEFDHVSSSHLRLGENASFHPEEMEILEYKCNNEIGDTIQSEILEKYPDYPGDYKNPKNGNTVTVLLKNGNLAAKLPNGMILELNEPNEEGFWYSKLSASVNFSFHKNDDGIVNEMWIQEIVPLVKKENEDTDKSNVPNKFIDHIGTYTLDALGVSFIISYNDGLEVYNQSEQMRNKLIPTKTKGKYLDDDGMNAYVFERNDSGDITHIRVYFTVVLNKLSDNSNE